MLRTSTHATMPQDDRPQVKNDSQYETLRNKGMSKSKAARIANTPDSSKKGGKHPPYEEWTRDELYDQAQNADIEGRSKMSKDELIDALRSR